MPPAAKTYTLRLVALKDKGAMGLCVEDGCCATFKKRTFETAAMGKVSLSVSKTGMHAKGADWKAYAHEIIVREDGRVTLRGDVRLVCDKLGVCATVKAEELCVEVKKGKFEKFVTK